MREPSAITANAMSSVAVPSPPVVGRKPLPPPLVSLSSVNELSSSSMSVVDDPDVDSSSTIAAVDNVAAIDVGVLAPTAFIAVTVNV